MLASPRPYLPRIPLLSTLGALVLSTSAFAQMAPERREKPAFVRPTLRAESLVEPLRIDGRLDEPAWAAAPAASDFTESWPNPGKPADERTEVRVLYDAGALYVGLRAFDPSPDSIAASLMRRDGSGVYSDWLHVLIDSYHDLRTAFRFSVNPRGVQKDVFTFDDGNEDLSWDAVWDVATLIDSLGWTAEFRIPLSQLRYHAAADGEARVWGFQVMRDVARHEKRLVWSPWTPQSAGLVSAFGKLTGLDGVRPVRRIEVQPYASSRLTRAPGDPRDPFYERSDLGGSLGADFKLGLSSGLTLTGTINPDFGQVEVDPAVVNLTAFETFFPEKRPFFIEGAEVFRFGQVRSFNRYSFQQFFYSRRIGRPPRLGVSEADVAYSEQPDQTTILGAAKVTGKAGAWTIGMMDALTAREQARFVTSTGLEDESAVEPLSNSFVGRLRRELRGGSTVIGGMATAVHRRLETAAFEQALPRRAFLGGIDFQHGWAGRAWDLSGFVVASRVQGTSTVISALQQASARYYQRPDAQAVELDPTRVRLDGHMADLALTHTGTWDLSLDYKQASPGFEMNDLGFHGRTDYRSFSTFAGRRVNRTGRVFREHNYFAFTNHAWNWDGDVIFDAYAVGANGTFQNLWWTGMNLGLERDALSDRLTRGGPLAQDPGGWWFNVRGGSDSRKRLSAAGFLFYSQGNAGSHERSAELELDFRPSSAVRVRLGPSLGRSASPAQYLQTEPDSLALDTYGRRYVFAEIERTTLSMDTRVDWTFSPTLSLQLYAQPFLATGDFRDFKEFRVPRTFAFDVYSRDRGTIQRVETRDGVRYDVDPDGAGPAAAFSVAEPDFNVRSLRGNAVLRWEYRPGSVLYLVWQQNRSGFAPTGEFDFRRDARGIFRAPGTNVFLVKVTYWLGL